MSITFYEGDLPDDFDYGNIVAIDTETMGLNPNRDRLCLVQISTDGQNATLVRIAQGQKKAPNLERMLSDGNCLKIFHFARFDVAILKKALDIDTSPIYCTKIASKLVRTYTDKHGLAAITSELLGVDLSKAQQSSDWGAEQISDAQKEYAASDVYYLHRIKEILDTMLLREGRIDLAQKCFDFLPMRARLDLEGWAENDIFSHR